MNSISGRVIKFRQALRSRRRSLPSSPIFGGFASQLCRMVPAEAARPLWVGGKAAGPCWLRTIPQPHEHLLNLSKCNSDPKEPTGAEFGIRRTLPGVPPLCLCEKCTDSNGRSRRNYLFSNPGPKSVVRWALVRRNNLAGAQVWLPEAVLPRPASITEA
jgi:hypothetical protein